MCLNPLVITPDCVSAEEFDQQIDRLHAELEAVRKTARTKYAACERQQLAKARALTQHPCPPQAAPIL